MRPLKGLKTVVDLIPLRQRNPRETAGLLLVVVDIGLAASSLYRGSPDLCQRWLAMVTGL